MLSFITRLFIWLSLLAFTIFLCLAPGAYVAICPPSLQSSAPTALFLSSATILPCMGSCCLSHLNLGCHKISYSSWKKPTQIHCQMQWQWIHCLSEREFLTVYLLFPVIIKKSNVVPPSTYLYICQLRIRWRFSWGFAKETQRKQYPIHTELHWLQGLSLPSCSSVTELPWTCPPHGLRHTGYAIDKH